MIARLTGTILEKRVDGAIVDVQGVGYLVHLSLQSLSKLPPEGARAQLRCYTHVREDALQLFGFLTAEEEELFHLLISVSGVGPKLALNVLSGMPAAELAVALLHGELARLTKIAGVGKKTAERLVVELKDKLKTSALLARGGAAARPKEAVPADGALVSALLNLGYKPASVQRTAEAVRRALGPGAGLEEQLREALKVISGTA
ncbi:MAG: Holliday junction branch migration protein RuvA [Myxococcales bacterium]